MRCAHPKTGGKGDQEAPRAWLVGPSPSEREARTGANFQWRTDMKSIGALTIAAAVLMSAASAFAQDPIVYPQKGQSKEQQEKDEFECHKWAKEKTGFDPMAQPSSPAAAAPAPRGGAVRGAARGAALGAIGGAIAGDAGKGAAIGAGVGGAGGALRQRGQVRQQQQAQQAEASAQNAQRSQYQRAYGACLEGRGYTVK
jgi:hypothetical protein